MIFEDWRRWVAVRNMMDGNAYLDFDLRFTADGQGGYRAEIVQSPAGRAHQVFRLPFGDHELENYLLKIGQRHTGVRKVDAPENHAAREFGDKLFETVFQAELESTLRRSLETARAAGQGLRLRLHLGETPELSDLPWEYLYHARRREFFALSTETPIVRYFDLPETVKPLAVTPPLRVLVMLSNPSDVDRIEIEEEWQKLKEAVKHLEEAKLLIVERLERATLGELQRRLRKQEYHIFHFVGHGSFDPVTQESVLALEDENGRKRLVSGPDLGIYLRDEPALRLVLLNACEGGRASRTDPFSGAAQSLVLKGIPAVIAMQFEVSDEAAIALASGFYGALADNYPVDAALTEARKAVFAAGCSVEWGTPVLYLRAPDGRIFDVARSAAPRPPVIPVIPPPDPPVRKLERQESALSRWKWPLLGIAALFIIGTVGLLVGLGFLANATRSTQGTGQAQVLLKAPAYFHEVPMPSPQGPVTGLKITVPVSVLHAANQQIQLIVKFSYANGQPLWAHPAETQFRNQGGHVATGLPMRVVTSNDEPFTEWAATIPYYALNMAPTNFSTTHDLAFVVEVYVNNQVAAQSAPVPFEFRW